VVGARRASSYGREIARQLGRELGAAGITVISGMAFGIDACAHRGALEAGRTVAVLACGPDVAYPAAHRSLWRRIQENGLVLSELPPGTGAWRWSFPARNRIIAALAGMTVLVEAAERSRSLLTAEIAVKLGRRIGAVPGPVSSAASAGPNQLLAAGASVVRGGEEALELLGASRPGPKTNTAIRPPFRFDRERARRRIEDPDGPIWPVNRFSEADELNLLFEAALEDGVIEAPEPRIGIQVYPLSNCEPAPVLAIHRAAPPDLLGAALNLAEREGESPLDFTLRLLEEGVEEANAILLASRRS
jgi:DNA protecting protein DprA